MANGQKLTCLAAVTATCEREGAGGARLTGARPLVAARAHRSPGAVRARRESRAIGGAGIQACSLWRCHAAGQAREQWERMVSRAVASLGFAPRMLGASTAIAKGKDYCITGEKKTSCVWRHVVCAFACSYQQRSLAQKKTECVVIICRPSWPYVL